MTKKLEEVFNIGPTESSDAGMSMTREEFQEQIQELEGELTISEQLSQAFASLKGVENHDGEMDEIAQEALDSYRRLMVLGMQMTDMAAGPVFNNATSMLKVALEARDSKVDRRLKQADLMLKKDRLDWQKERSLPDTPTEEEEIQTRTFDRNALLSMLNQASQDQQGDENNQNDK